MPHPYTVDRYGYRIAGQKYPRVTSILGAIAKPALIGWAAKVVAEYAVANRGTWETLSDPEAVRLLKGVPTVRRDTAADRGSVVHAVIEATLKGTPLPDFNEEELSVAIAAESFLRVYRPEPLAVEVTVYSPTMRYAGTCDLPCIIDGEQWICDWKTSGGVYADYALQLYAYSIAERAIIGGADVPVPWTNPRLGVVHLTAKGYTLHEVRASRAKLDAAWRAALTLHGWLEGSDSVLATHEPEIKRIAS